MRAVSVVGGAALSVALVVLGLWAWHHAAEVTASADEPYAARWAVKCAAVAAAAAAQAVLLVMVVGRLYRRQLGDDVLRVTTVVVFRAALGGALVLGLAGR